MSWMSDPNERSQLLQDLMNPTGIPYEELRNSHGWPYARFQFPTRGGAYVPLTVLVQELVLRITAHGDLVPLSRTSW